MIKRKMMCREILSNSEFERRNRRKQKILWKINCDLEKNIAIFRENFPGTRNAKYPQKLTVERAVSTKKSHTYVNKHFQWAPGTVRWRW